MTTKEERARAEAANKLVAVVVRDIKQGHPKSATVNRLVEAGVPSTEAARLVESVHAELEQAAQREVLTGQSLLLAVLGAGLAAIAGGLVWGAIVIATDYEIGFMATGIGLLAGFGVAGLSGKRGLPLQLTAVLASLTGILVGKYIIFFSVFREFVGQEYGAAAIANVTLFSPDVISTFFQSFFVFLSPYDVLWVILAVLAAWRIPRGLGFRPQPNPVAR
jgi:hypothetical protein